MKAAARTVPAVTRPATTGLPIRPAAASLAASTASLHQPTESWPVSTASATGTAPGSPRPASTTSAVTRTVTATAGPGWHARASPASCRGMSPGSALEQVIVTSVTG